MPRSEIDAAFQMTFKRIRDKMAVKPPRSKAWKKFVVEDRDCGRCHKAPACDPHHLFGSFGPLKTSDIATIGVCRQCHDKVTADPLDKIEEMFLTWMLNMHEWISKAEAQ